MKNKKRDEAVLTKIRSNQKDISDGLKKYKIHKPANLSAVDPLVRKGFVMSVGNIFELTKQLTDSTLNMLNLDNIMIKQFRDRVFHNYEATNDLMVLTWISYCVRADIISSVNEALRTLQER